MIQKACAAALRDRRRGLGASTLSSRHLPTPVNPTCGAASYRSRDSVEGVGAADRKNGRPEALKLFKVEQVGADQHAEAAPA